MNNESEKAKLISALCRQYHYDMLMNDSSEEEEEDEIQENFRMNLIHLLSNRRSIHLGPPKSSVLDNKILKKFDNNRFNEIFRLSSNEFGHIYDLIKHDEVFHTRCENLQLPTELQLKIVLYRLESSGDDASTRKIASLFGIGAGGTIQNITRRVFQAILKLKNRFLYWPDERERTQLISATKDQLPGCVGYIGGSEIKLAEAPNKRHELYFSRKRQYAIKIQAVCDNNLRIRQLTMGYPGSVHDAKIFSNCSLAKNPRRYLHDGQWLAGDNAYPLTDFLITPFRRDSLEHSTEIRNNFNKYFSKYQVKIENCFDLLKEKFSSLKELRFRMMKEQNKRECNDWIRVCCILHNILIYLNSETDSNYENLSISNIARVNTRNDLLRFIDNQSNLI